MTVRLNDWFCGAGGATQGAHAVPGIVPVLAANHDQLAIDTHATNFPNVEHFRGDIRDLDVAGHPYAELFWSSPECKNWSVAKGKTGDYAHQPGLFGDPDVGDDVARSRALMQDVIRYLDGMALRQRPVLAGVVENVVDIRRWVHWHDWRARIERLGYRTRLIALNSMHAQSVRTPRAPQSRDRLYLAYWHETLGRDPDWDRWLRPAAWCPTCEETVAAVQAWKRAGVDMGRYRQQYVYRCPRASCRHQVVEPDFVPAAAAIDWGLPGERIGDRAKPLAAKTIARIEAGIRKYARHEASWAQTARNEIGLAVVPPFLTTMRGGGSREAAYATDEAALATVSAGGNHHGLVTMQAWAALYGYDTGQLRSARQALPTQTTVEGDALLTGHDLPAVEDCLFRMLEPHEIHAGMAFTPDYVVLGNKRQRVRQLGNAVTPPTAEVLIAALVECISGEQLDLEAAA